MENDPIFIITGFRKTANELFDGLCHDFIDQAKKLDRQTDENVFQQLRSRYEGQLQQQLNREAMGLLQEYKRDDILSLHQSLTGYISYCLSAFRIKAGSL
ncbi:MAG: hypothetical protein QM640_05955 [Niabella sp.]